MESASNGRHPQARDPRTWLFSPGDSPTALASRGALAADARILDLEDGCDQTHLRAARAGIAEATAQLAQTQSVYVRIHEPVSDECALDIATAIGPFVSGVVVPKVRAAHDLERIDALLSSREAALGLAPSQIGVSPLVETASGLHALSTIARAPRVRRLLLGELDLALDLGIADPASPTLAVARALVVITSRAIGLAAPIAGVWTALSDPDGLAAAAARARRDGFGGMLCLHPRQLAVVTDAFMPTTQEFELAARVVAEAEAHPDRAVFLLDGEMVDKPRIDEARRLLRQRAT